MKNIYTSYSKTVLGKNYFFVKKYLTFPEFNNVPDVLVGYGMHTDFDKACSIAMVRDVSIRMKLLNSMARCQEQAKIIEMIPRNGNSKVNIR